MSAEQTACIVKLAERMRLLVELRGKSEVGRSLEGSGRDASAADVDGAESPSGPRGHHESVGERQGRQPAPDYAGGSA